MGFINQLTTEGAPPCGIQYSPNQISVYLGDAKTVHTEDCELLLYHQRFPCEHPPLDFDFVYNPMVSNHASHVI